MQNIHLSHLGAAKSNIYDQAHQRGGYHWPLLPHLAKEPRHSRLGLFFRTKHFVRCFRTHQGSGQASRGTRPSITRIPSVLEWPSRERFQYRFQVTAKLQEENELRTWDWRWSLFLLGSSGFFLWQVFQSTSLHFVHSSYSLQWLSQVITYSWCPRKNNENDNGILNVLRFRIQSKW